MNLFTRGLLALPFCVLAAFDAGAQSLAPAAPPARFVSASTPVMGVTMQWPKPAIMSRAASQTVVRPRTRSLTRTILGAVVGATAGFFAGGYTGAWIEGDGCGCDDPGLKGALIGAPIGAVAGGILGGYFLF